MTLVASLALFLTLNSSTTVLAQFARTDTIQSGLAGKPATEQAAALADIVRKAWRGRACAQASASFQKDYDKGGGGWLVTCDGETDYWVIVPAASTLAGIVTPCALAWTADLNCYASLRTIAPEDASNCDIKSTRIDPMIRSCSAIIQSGRLTNRPDALAVVYGARAVAYDRSGQQDASLADFDQAVALQPDDVNHRYNRAVALERKGKFDQALVDLDKVLAAKPDNWSASYERGYVLMKKGNYDRAIEDFDLVLRVNPGFEKAAQQRAAALQAKQGATAAPASPSKSPLPDASAAVVSNGEPAASELDQKAAYCMEASFGFVQQQTKFVQLLKQNQDKLRALQQQAGLSEADRAQIQAGLKGLDGKVAQSEADRAKWDGDLKILLGYLQKHGIFSRTGTIQAMSAKAAVDQRAVQETYLGCLRTCSPNNQSCKTSCNETAEASEGSQRMKQCDRVAKDIP